MPPDPVARPPHVVVVGGGIAGLAAAAALRELRSDARVTVLEAGPVLGGKLRSSEVAGVVVDEGADSWLARVPEGTDLARFAGLGDELVAPATTSASLWTRGRLRPLPTGTVLGVPADLRALARSGVLSARGLARVPVDLVLPGSPVTADVAVADYVGRRLGREVVDRLVDPLLGGVYAGRAATLSLQATLPQLAAHLRGGPSLVRAARTSRAGTSASAGPVFLSPPGGLDRLAEGVARRSAAEVRTRAPVRELHRRDAGWRLVLGPVPSPETVDADAVVLAVPAAPAARLLADVHAAVAAELAGIEYASVAIVTMAWRGVPSPAGSGFLVPPSEGRLVKAATFSSRKWAHLDRSDLTLARASVGRYGDERDLQRDDDDLASAVAAEISLATRLPARPFESRVTRWGGALPQYAVGHLDRVLRIRTALASWPDLAVCGAAYDGVGIPACIRSGRAAAAAVAATLLPGGG